MGENVASILTEEMDEETLSKMPLWFKIIREGYRRVLHQKQSQF
jgi:hypothetical protein